MKLKINWDDNIAIIGDVEYEMFYISFNNHFGCNIDEYIEEYPDSIYYRKDDLILENAIVQYYLIKLDKNDKIIERWKFHEITN